MRFLYKSRTKEGKIRKGIIEVSSRKNALDLLEKYGLYPISLKSLAEPKIWERQVIFKRIPARDIIIFIRQLGLILKTGISSLEALRIQVVQIENNEFREKVLKMGEMIERGETFSQAFRIFPEIFDSFSISIIKAGETSGRIVESLDYLTIHLEKRYRLRQKIINALIYPLFILITFIAVFLLISFFIIPNLIQLLENFPGKIPLTTKILISFSNFIREGGWIILIGFLIILFILFLTIKRSLFFKKKYDYFILKIPFIGDLVKKIYLVQFSENFSTLLAAGLPITQTLLIIYQIIGNLTYKEVLKKTHKEVLAGENLSSIFAKYPQQIPPFVTQLINVGEKTGTLDQTLKEVVKFYEEEVEQITNNLSSLIEPILLIFLGFVVGVLAIAIFIPLFKIGMGVIGEI